MVLCPPFPNKEQDTGPIILVIIILQKIRYTAGSSDRTPESRKVLFVLIHLRLSFIGPLHQSLPGSGEVCQRLLFSVAMLGGGVRAEFEGKRIRLRMREIFWQLWFWICSYYHLRITMIIVWDFLFLQPSDLMPEAVLKCYI
jgi:hypothetical protein